MAYNGHGQGQNSSSYYSMQNHQSSVSVPPSNDSYRGQQNEYPPYYQTPSSYGSQPDATSYRTKASARAPSTYDETKDRSQKHAQQSDTDSYSYAQQQTQSQYQASFSPTYSVSVSKKGGNDDGARRNNSRSYADTSALGNLAYASTISGTGIDALSGQSSHSTAANTREYHRSSPLSKEQQSSQYSVYAPSQPPSNDRHLSNPTQYQVNYPSHVRGGSDNSTKHVSSAQRHRAASGNQSRGVNSPKQSTVQCPSINKPTSSDSRIAHNPTLTPTSISAQAPPATTTYNPTDLTMDRGQTGSSHGRTDSIRSQDIAQSIEQPTTVNPTQIFSPPQLTSRRPAIATETENKNQSDAQKGAKSDTQTREQIQAEMKAMIEKMREYKAADPSAFSEIWEQFKKVQPPPQRASSQAPAGNKSTPTPIIIPNREAAVMSPVLTGGAFSPPPPSLDGVSTAGEKPPPDIGKFPAMRQETGTDKGGSQKGKAEDPAKNTPSTNAHRVQTTTTMLGHVSIPKLSVHEPSPADSMRLAMQSFHKANPTQVSQNTQAPHRPDQTIWPENKRTIIAGTIKSYLDNFQGNKGKSISSLEILTLLAEDPSYDALCHELSKKGLAFNRGVLARTLLSIAGGESSVPSSTAPQTFDEGSLVLSMEGNGQRSIQAHGTSQMTGSQTSPPQYLPYHQSPFATQLPFSSGVRKTSSTTLPQPRATHAPKPPAPQTKQEMARKRNFSEIVDLTSFDEEEETMPQQKRVQSREDTLTLTQSMPKGFYNSRYEPAPVATTESLRTIDFATSTPAPALVSHGRDIRKMAVVKPLPKIAKMLPINVNTICRDILITMGRHPTERPLNYHLKDLAKNFEQVDRHSDLSTFRWDLVDPGGPPVPTRVEEPVEEAMRTPTRSNFIDQRDAEGQRTNQFQSIMTRGRGRGRGRPRGRPSTRGGLSRPVPNEDGSGNSIDTPNGNVLVSRGRGQGGLTRGGASLPHHINSPSSSQPMPNPQPGKSKAAGGQYLGPSVFSKDFLTSFTNQQPDSTEKNEPRTPSQPAPKPVPVNAVDSTVKGVAVAPVISVAQTSPSSTPQPGLPSGRRRGRPPGSKNKARESQGNPLPSVKLGAVERAILSGADQSPLSGTEQSDRTSDIPGLPKKKRGRPPGSKNLPKLGREASRPNTSVPADGIGIMIRSRSPSQVNLHPLSYVENPAQGPQTWNAINSQPDSSPTTAIFKSFPCQWYGCVANLHNLGNLRKHTLKFHGSIPGDGSSATRVRCLWTGCDFDGTFAAGSSLPDHIEEAHLKKLAWRMGDGPSTHPEVVNPLTFLSDSQGRQVTPLILDYGPPDPLPLNAGASPTRAYHRAHGNKTWEQKQKAVEASLRWHRAAAGGKALISESASEKDSDESTDEEIPAVQKVQVVIRRNAYKEEESEEEDEREANDAEDEEESSDGGSDISF